MNSASSFEYGDKNKHFEEVLEDKWNNVDRVLGS